MVQTGRFTDEEAAFRYVDPVTCLEYTEEYIGKLVENALLNFDLNMMYFDRLDSQEFENALDKMLAEFPLFRPVTDLREWIERPGLYVMVLDNHRQMYLGQSKCVGKRIRQHWSTSKPLDRLVFGPADTSVLSVDSFRALDTTRVYAWATQPEDDLDALEEQIVADVDPGFALNRVHGGGLGSALRGIRAGGLKGRDLTASSDEWEKYWAIVDATPGRREVHPYGWQRKPQTRKRSRPPVFPDAEDNPIEVLAREANQRPPTATIPVDAGGTIIDICEGAVPKSVDKYLQLFAVPCGMDISVETMESAIGGARAWINENTQPPIALFEILRNSTVSIRRPE